MEPRLTPRLALGYLHELSADVLGGIVVDGEGRRLAGTPELEAPARALLDAAGAVKSLELATPSGWVFGIRAREASVLVATGPHALGGLMRHDLTEVAALLDGAPAGTARAPQKPPEESLRALAVVFHDTLMGARRSPSPDR